MINSGLSLLRVALHPRRADREQGARRGRQPGAHRRREGRVAVGRAGRSTRRRSTASTSRWCARARSAVCSTRVLLRLADTIEKQVELRRKVKSAMTYPVVVRRARACSSSPPCCCSSSRCSRTSTRSSAASCRLPTQILINVSKVVRKYWCADLRCSTVGAVVLLPPLDQAPRGGRRQLGRGQAADAGLRSAGPQDRARPLLAHAVGAGPLGRADPRVARHRRRDRRATTSWPRRVRDTQSAVKRGEPLAERLERASRCSRRWSCR